MASLSCPECGLEIISRTGSCSKCGFDLENETSVCYECGTVLKKSAVTCKNCGAPVSVLNEDVTKTNTASSCTSKNKKIGIGMIIAACILFVVAFTRVNNDEYKFYKQHYEECEAGYIDTKSMANSYSGGLFKSSYNSIANSYQKMMDDDMKETNKFRIQAVVCLAAGVVLVFIGSKKVREVK